MFEDIFWDQILLSFSHLGEASVQSDPPAGRCLSGTNRGKPGISLDSLPLRTRGANSLSSHRVIYQLAEIIACTAVIKSEYVGWWDACWKA